MQVNTATGTLKPTVTELRQLEKSRKFLVSLGKHGDDAMQEDAAKAVGAINRIQLAFAGDEEQEPPADEADEPETLASDQTKAKKRSA